MSGTCDHGGIGGWPAVAPMAPGSHRVLVISHIVPSCSADAPSPPPPTNHKTAASRLDQSQPGDNIEAGRLDQ